MRTVAVVLAGGSGERFGTPVPKQLLLLAGRPMIEHSVAAFERAPGVDRILVVMAAGHADEVSTLLEAGGEPPRVLVLTACRTAGSGPVAALPPPAASGPGPSGGGTTCRCPAGAGTSPTGRCCWSATRPGW